MKAINHNTIGMVNGDNVTVSVKDGKVVLNNSATIVASVKASNGMVHIVDAVLLHLQKSRGFNNNLNF